MSNNHFVEGCGDEDVWCTVLECEYYNLAFV